MFYTLSRRYRVRRFAVFRSMPLSGPAPADYRNSCAYRTASGRGIPARLLAGGSSPQHIQHGPQGRDVHARADAAAARRSSIPVPLPAPLCAPAGARSSPPGRTAPARFPGAVYARHRRSIQSDPVPYRTASRRCRCAVVPRSVPPTPPLSGWPSSVQRQCRS